MVTCIVGYWIPAVSGLSAEKKLLPLILFSDLKGLQFERKGSRSSLFESS